MTKTASFKFCANCNTKHGRLARVCKSCGGKAIWIAPTCEQVEAAQAHSAKMEALLQSFLIDPNHVICMNCAQQQCLQA